MACKDIDPHILHERGSMAPPYLRSENRMEQIFSTSKEEDGGEAGNEMARFATPSHVGRVPVL
jgi:hypothetical protein